MKLIFFGYCFSIFVVLTLIAIFILSRNGGGILSSIMQPVSVASQIIANEELKETDGRTNFLILGIDQRSAKSGVSGSLLTDTIMVISVGKTGTSTVMISLPRDLWVSEIGNKINALYALSNKQEEMVIDKVEQILGIPIHYHAIVGFGVFVDSINAVGGIDVNIEESFTDSMYPIEGRESAEPESSRYKTIRFNKGIVTLNGESALEFARSRHADNPLEQGDFARARRQQKVIDSLKNKVLSNETFLNPAKLSELYNAIYSNVKTNIGLSEILSATKGISSYETKNILRIVLSNETFDENKLGSGSLYAPSLEEREQKFNKLYVLAPLGGDYENIKSIVRKALFCNGEDSVSCN